MTREPPTKRFPIQKFKKITIFLGGTAKNTSIFKQNPFPESSPQTHPVDQNFTKRIAYVFGNRRIQWTWKQFVSFFHNNLLDANRISLFIFDRMIHTFFQHHLCLN